MPMIFMVNANNSSISSRIDMESSEEAVNKIIQRFEGFGVMSSGHVTPAEDAGAGLAAVRKAVDDALETGKPSYVITHYPFRPLGHASDGHPGADEYLLHQFDSYSQSLYDQITTAAELGQSGSSLANDLDYVQNMIEDSVKRALTGDKILTREQMFELSVPGSGELKKDSGAVVDLKLNYLLGKGAKGFAGMGAEVYSRAFDRFFNQMEEEGREVRYIDL